jgi:hypothetical protein
LVSAVKDPAKVRAGQAGARKRWGTEPIAIRLDQLTNAQRRLVVALVAAVKEQAVAETQTPVTADAEVRRVGVDPA